MSKHQALIVLDALLNGIIIDAQNGRYCLNEANQYCLIGHTDDGVEVLLPVDYSLQAFITDCEKMPFDKVFMLNAINGFRRGLKKRR